MQTNSNYLAERRQNKAYWQKRALIKINRFEKEAEAVENELNNSYITASNTINVQVRKIFAAFENAFKLSETEAKRLIAKAGNKAPSKAILQVVNNISDPDQKREMQAAISAPAYKWRMDRLDKLAKQVEKLCKDIAVAEIAKDTAFLGAQMEKAYNYAFYDLQRGTGLYGAFDIIPKSRIEQVLKTNWSGKHFSDRIWSNTADLADELRQSFVHSFVTGESIRKAAVRVQERFGVASFEARRLLRTEHTYVCGQADLESYKSAGITQYEYSALLDNRTSLICRRLDGKIFEVAKAKAGVNYPPMHPFCRSSTLAVLPTEEELDKWWDKFNADNVPDDMTFDEWLDCLEPTEDGKLVFKGRNAGETIDNSGKSGIIKVSKTIRKAVEIPEDCEYILKAETNFANKNISPDILKTINSAIGLQTKIRADFSFDEIKIAQFSDSDKSVFITNLENYGFKSKTQLYLNRKYFIGSSKDEIDLMCQMYYSSGWWKSKSLSDLTNHEIMHARINYHNSFEKVEQLYEVLKEDSRTKGFCHLVDKYPEEFLNEMYVAINNGEHIDDKYVDVYNQYIKEYLGGE